MSMISDFQRLMQPPEEHPAFSESGRYFIPPENAASGESSLMAVMRNSHALLVAELISARTYT